jgi:hypothetical protein
MPVSRRRGAEALDELMRQVRSCTHCADRLTHPPRPVLRAGRRARAMPPSSLRDEGLTRMGDSHSTHPNE